GGFLVAGIPAPGILVFERSKGAADRRGDFFAIADVLDAVRIMSLESLPPLLPSLGVSEVGLPVFLERRKSILFEPNRHRYLCFGRQRSIPTPFPFAPAHRLAVVPAQKCEQLLASVEAKVAVPITQAMRAAVLDIDVDQVEQFADSRFSRQHE